MCRYLIKFLCICSCNWPRQDRQRCRCNNLDNHCFWSDFWTEPRGFYCPYNKAKTVRAKCFQSVIQWVSQSVSQLPADRRSVDHSVSQLVWQSVMAAWDTISSWILHVRIILTFCAYKYLKCLFAIRNQFISAVNFDAICICLPRYNVDPRLARLQLHLAGCQDTISFN